MSDERIETLAESFMAVREQRDELLATVKAVGMFLINNRTILDGDEAWALFSRVIATVNKVEGR